MTKGIFSKVLGHCMEYKFTENKYQFTSIFGKLGPVVQSVVSSMSSLVVKILTVLISTISNSQIFLLKKCE